MSHPYKATQDLTALALREFWAVVAHGNKGRTRRHASRNHVCNVTICGPGTRNDGIRIAGIGDTPKSDCDQGM